MKNLYEIIILHYMLIYMNYYFIDLRINVTNIVKVKKGNCNVNDKDIL